MWKTYPEDFIHGTLGIKLPINSKIVGSKVGLFNMSKSTEEQAISNYINLLLTRRGERYMQPDFGVGLYLYLFENATNEYKKSLKNEIETQSSIWLPYIINKNIQISDAPFDNSPAGAINIEIEFSVFEAGSNKTIKFYPGVGKRINVEIQ